MDKQRLVEIFSRVDGTTFVGIDTATKPRVSGPLSGRITKHVYNMNVMCFQNPQWETLVNRRLRAAGLPSDFKAGPRPWGTRVPNMPIVDYADNYYLEVIVLTPGKVVYSNCGLVVDKDTIQGLDDRPAPEHGVMVRCFHADSIQCVHLNGLKFR